MTTKLLLTAAVWIGAASSLWAQETPFCALIGREWSDYALGAALASNGDLLLTGATYSYGLNKQDLYVLRVSPSGSIRWARRIGGWDIDVGKGITETPDGDVVAAGYMRVFPRGDLDMLITRWDAAGQLKWSVLVGDSSHEEAYDVVATADGGVVVVGRTLSFGQNGDVYVVKLDAEGHFLWSRIIGSSGDEWADAIVEAANGDLVVAGVTTSYGQGWDVFLIRLDPTGNVRWMKGIGTSGYERAMDLAATHDGGFALAGLKSNRLYVLKVDSAAQLLWEKSIGGAGNTIGHSIVETPDGGLIVAGVIGSYDAGMNAYVVKLDYTGQLLWTRALGGADDDLAYEVVQLPSGTLAVVGQTLSFGATGADIFLATLGPDGNGCCSLDTDGQSQDENSTVFVLDSIHVLRDSGWVIPFNGVLQSGAQIRFVCGEEPAAWSPPESINRQCIIRSEPEFLAVFCPTGITHRQAILSTIDGRPVAQCTLTNGVCKLNIASLPGGVYWLRIDGMLLKEFVSIEHSTVPK